MPLVCRHCSRVSPGDARYCYHDGVSLVGAAGPASRLSFPAPFVFPSGLTCLDFDAFIAGCEREWSAAVDLLHQGFLQQFFNSIGRTDLALAAREAAAFPDRDRGLDQLLARLPAKNAGAAKLEVQPKLINLGTLKVGQNSKLELALENLGSRLIFGSVTTSCDWLVAADTGNARLFQFRNRATMPIQVKGQHLRASNKPLEGDLLVESNAGTFRLKVIASVPIQAFPDGCLAGARTPRELAEKAKKFPKDAGALFASGAVASWYKANGWTYPVQGPASTGMAAVQQFFEALGLSRAPKVTLAQPRLELRGTPGAKLTQQIVIRSEENRPVYAHATSNASWCAVKPALMQGNAVTIPLEIVVPNDGSASAQAIVRIVSNGQQRFDVPVQVTIERASAAAVIVPGALRAFDPQETVAMPKSTISKPTPTGPVISPTYDQSPRKSFDPVKLALHLVPLALLLLIVLGLTVKDVLSDAPKRAEVAVVDETPKGEPDKTVKEVAFEVAIKDEPDEGSAPPPMPRHTIQDEPEERFAKLPLPPVEVKFKDEPPENNAGQVVPVAKDPLVSYLTSKPPRTFGMSCTAAAGVARGKRLTFDLDGATNSTIVSSNGKWVELGGFAGKWSREGQALDKIAPTPDAVNGSHSTWTWGTLAFHQVLEVVPGQTVTVDGAARRQLDTVLVRWVIENTGRAAVPAGLRLQLDTLIGINDGVPFTVPGRTGLVSTMADFRQDKDIPDFIQALEVPNLKNPGTIAHLTLKPGGGIEAPGRVSLTHWPNHGVRFGGPGAWDVPMRNMFDDSCVVLYWPEKAIKPGEKRTIGFAYGLGNVTINDKLGITLGGQFEPGQNFTVSAYVENPVAGQTLKLELPDGLRRVEGDQMQNVALGGKTSIVTWKVLVERTGEFKLKVISSTGLSQAKTITIARGEAPTGGKLTLDLQGKFEPGETFNVIGKVTEPIANQTLTLHLPAGLEKTGGADMQTVPAPPAGSKDSIVQWQVRVKEPGKFPVRVSSSTGIAQTKTITIVQPGRSDGAFQIALDGPFEPGKAFTVSTKVRNPIPDQKLTLVLPEGLQRADGAETQTAQNDVLLSWKVKVEQPGKYTVGLKSTSGVTQRKTLVIEPPGDAGGRFDFKLEGEIRPSKEFKVVAEVTKPVAGQTLTLVLPKGLQLTGGDAKQTVAPGAVSKVNWSVRVTESGRLPVRIESSTGLTKAKTITLAEPNSSLFGR